MNQVEFIQRRIIEGMTRQVALIRVTVSGTEGNQPAIEALRNERFDRLIAKLTAVMLEHMGHDAQEKNHRGEASGLNANSTISRSIKRVNGKRVDEPGSV